MIVMKVGMIKLCLYLEKVWFPKEPSGDPNQVYVSRNYYLTRQGQVPDPPSESGVTGRYTRVAGALHPSYPVPSVLSTLTSL